MNDSKAVQVVDRACLKTLHEHATLAALLGKAHQFCGCELLVRLGHMKASIEKRGVTVLLKRDIEDVSYVAEYYKLTETK
jgi:hypothetical protein